MLGTRIAELEHRIKVLEISGLWSTPGGVEHKSDENHYEPTITWEEVEEEVKEEVEGEGIVFIYYIHIQFVSIVNIIIFIILRILLGYFTLSTFTHTHTHMTIESHAMDPLLHAQDNHRLVNSTT